MPQLTEEQTSLAGKESQPRPAPYPVNEAMARFWCEMVEDANPIYFDGEYAHSTRLEAPFAPPAMLFTWGMPPVWPEADRSDSAISRLSLSGCTTTLAVNATQEYLLPLRYGDTLTITNQIASIGEEKTTRLGTGHFVTTLDTFRNQRSEVAGTHSFTLFMYEPAAAPPVGAQHQPPRSTSAVDSKTKSAAGDTKLQNAAPVRPAGVDAARPPEKLPSISLPLTLRRAIQAVAGTRDYYPFHHDEQFARENGVEGIFLNTMFLQAFAGRCATEWFGNDAFLRRLEIAMRAPNYVGRTLTVDAAVTGVREDDHRRLVDVEGTLLTEDGLTTGVKWTAEVPAS
jgi:acyl dehydratase